MNGTSPWPQTGHLPIGGIEEEDVMEGGAYVGVAKGVKQNIYDLQELGKDDQVINVIVGSVYLECL